MKILRMISHNLLCIAHCHNTKNHFAQVDSTPAAFRDTPNLMAEMESTHNFGLEKLFKVKNYFPVAAVGL